MEPGAAQVASVREVSVQVWSPPRAGSSSVCWRPQAEQVETMEPGETQVGSVRSSVQVWSMRGIDSVSV